MEMLLGFILMCVILYTSQSKKLIQPFAGIAIGITVLFEALFEGAISGASMNPARSLSPSVIQEIFPIYGFICLLL